MKGLAQGACNTSLSSVNVCPLRILFNHPKNLASPQYRRVSAFMRSDVAFRPSESSFTLNGILLLCMLARQHPSVPQLLHRGSQRNMHVAIYTSLACCACTTITLQLHLQKTCDTACYRTNSAAFASPQHPLPGSMLFRIPNTTT